MPGGTDNAAALGEADGILGGIGVLAGFDFNKYKDGTVPGNDINFAGGDAIARLDDSIAKGTKMADGEELGAAAEVE